MYPNLPLSLVCLTLLPLPYTYACLQPSHLPGHPLNPVPACQGYTCNVPWGGHSSWILCRSRKKEGGHCPPGPGWWGARHVMEQALGTVQWCLQGLWKDGVRVVKSLLCWSQYWHCQNCHPACTGVFFPLCNSGKECTKHGRLVATHPVFCQC